MNEEITRVDRSLCYSELLEKDFKIEEFWNKYYFEDRTVFATSKENMSKKQMENIIKIDTDLGLFISAGVGWKHNKAEKEFLEILYRKTL